MESTDYSYPLGTHMTETIKLAVDLEPDDVQSPADVDSYAVMLYYDREIGEEDIEQVQIARIDDREHGGPHLDRFFSEEGGRDHLDPNLAFDEAEDQLRTNWRQYVRRYHDNFGF
ncbi:hypothetical protein [Halococcus sp. PRR34]|uniref:DUF7718 family protein n=1 Tax=Halococcus sp. PRR34 TaxID=3020830 RepID=UPI00236305BE|nr:hypothetical protein [Halococcus sp. PRR34]